MSTYYISGQTPSKKTSQRIISMKRKDGTTYPLLLPNKKYEQWVKGAKKQLQATHQHYGYVEPLDFPMMVTAHIYRTTKRKCDLINILQSIHDALVEGGIIKDDSLIQSVDGSRLWLGVEPGDECAIIGIESMPVEDHIRSDEVGQKFGTS